VRAVSHGECDVWVADDLGLAEPRDDAHLPDGADGRCRSLDGRGGGGGRAWFEGFQAGGSLLGGERSRGNLGQDFTL